MLFQVFFLFLSLFVILIMCMLHILVFFSWCLDILFLLSCCSFCFSVFEDSIDIFSSSEIFFLSYVQSTNKPIKDILYLFKKFTNFSSLTFFSFRISISLLHCPSLLACFCQSSEIEEAKLINHQST